VRANKRIRDLFPPIGWLAS